MSRFTFPVKTQQEIERGRLCPEGEFAATVDEANYKNTRNGIPMISLKLRFTTNEGNERTIFCNIMLNDDWAWLHRHFWESAGFVEKYEQGELAESEYTNRKVTIKIKNELNKNNNEMQSNVKDFLVKNETIDYRDSIGATTSFPDEKLPF